MNKEKEKITEIQEDFQVKFEIYKLEQKINEWTGKLEWFWAIFHSIEDLQNLIYNLSSICLNISEFIGF